MRTAMCADGCARLKRASTFGSQVSPTSCGTQTAEGHQWLCRVPQRLPDDQVPKLLRTTTHDVAGIGQNQRSTLAPEQWADDAVADYHLCVPKKPER